MDFLVDVMEGKYRCLICVNDTMFTTSNGAGSHFQRIHALTLKKLPRRPGECFDELATFEFYGFKPEYRGSSEDLDQLQKIEWRKTLSMSKRLAVGWTPEVARWWIMVDRRLICTWPRGRGSPVDLLDVEPDSGDEDPVVDRSRSSKDDAETPSEGSPVQIGVPLLTSTFVSQARPDWDSQEFIVRGFGDELPLWSSEDQFSSLTRYLEEAEGSSGPVQDALERVDSSSSSEVSFGKPVKEFALGKKKRRTEVVCIPETQLDQNNNEGDLLPPILEPEAFSVPNSVTAVMAMPVRVNQGSDSDSLRTVGPVGKQCVDGAGCVGISSEGVAGRDAGVDVDSVGVCGRYMLEPYSRLRKVCDVLADNRWVGAVPRVLSILDKLSPPWMFDEVEVLAAGEMWDIPAGTRREVIRMVIAVCKYCGMKADLHDREALPPEVQSPVDLTTFVRMMSRSS